MATEQSQRSAGDQLARIADLLDCSPDTLTNGVEGPADVSRLSELLKLWPRLDDDKRDELLGLARYLAQP